MAIQAHELEVAHTAIMLHWDCPPGGIPQVDQTFVIPRIITGDQLHQHVDCLLEEHVQASDGSAEVVTDVSIWWHHPDGRWELEEFVSHYYATDTKAL
jgi:hypothetical protein